jgi:hypothetical protein
LLVFFPGATIEIVSPFFKYAGAVIDAK